MAFTNVIRRAASGLIPSATRATRSQRYYRHKNLCTLLSDAAPVICPGALSQNLFRNSFSTAIQRLYDRKRSRVCHSNTETIRRQTDETLVKIFDSEIQGVEESAENYKVEDVPESFPFEIEDEPGQRTVTLTRNDHGESITVTVHMPEPDLLAGEKDDDEEDDDEEGNSDNGAFQLNMVVRVSKNDGPCLEFNIIFDRNKIEIETFSIKDSGGGSKGPDFRNLDEKVQKAFQKYLDIRGINTRSTNFLYDYMMNKESKEYVRWLTMLKKVIEA